MSSHDMEFRTAGKPATAKEEISYPHLFIDLDQFPGLEGDLDEEIELHVRGRVCSLSHSYGSHSMDVEVQKIAHPDHTHDDEVPKVAVISIADSELSRMKRRSL